MERSYNLPQLYQAGDKGQGVTIAIIDSFGNPNMASDLANFDTQMGLPHMCGDPGQACGTGIPTFQHLYWNGKTEVKTAPTGSHSPACRTAPPGPWKPAWMWSGRTPWPRWPASST